MLGTPISVLGGWPTISALYWYRMGYEPVAWYVVSRKPFQKSASTWWQAWKFLDSMGPGLPIAASFYKVA